MHNFTYSFYITKTHIKFIHKTIQRNEKKEKKEKLSCKHFFQKLTFFTKLLHIKKEKQKENRKSIRNHNQRLEKVDFTLLDHGPV